MGNWFGDLNLAYKYTVVFVSLLALTIVAGGFKVLYNRRKMKKFKAQQSEESGRKDDQVELNQREKDEGDLFGIRAIEAGFYAGIPQSRPTSRAGSFVDSPAMSSTTLVSGGGLATPKIQTHSMSSSVSSLPLAHTNDRTRDSDVLPGHNQRRKSPPTIRLAPSEAEINGRINHSAAVNMSLNVPPSPVLVRAPQSPAFGGSDDGESDGNTTPRSLSPRSANFRPDHYAPSAPSAPKIPMPEGLRVTVHDVEDTPKSQTASLRNPTPEKSPGHSAPPSPGPAPMTKLPPMPFQSSRKEQQSVRLQSQTYQPNHQRDGSDASSVYSAHRMSTHQHKNSSSTDTSYNYSYPEKSSRNSVTLQPPSQESSRRPSDSSSLLVPGSTAHNDKLNDPRFSEFYDAYYTTRHSHLVQTKSETAKRPMDLELQQQTIVEVPSPLPSPNPQQPLMPPGMAM